MIPSAVLTGEDSQDAREEAIDRLTNDSNPNKLEYIFDRFYRVEGSRSEETGGSGLGLAIAKRIVMLHGGSISAKSDMDGTVFEVNLKTIDRKEEAYEQEN